MQWTKLHFLRKESEWLHERDYGNKAAGQVKPMERDGASVGQAQRIVIKTADTTIEIPVNARPDVVAAAVSFLRQS